MKTQLKINEKKRVKIDILFTDETNSGLKAIPTLH